MITKGLVLQLVGINEESAPFREQGGVEALSHPESLM